MLHGIDAVSVMQDERRTRINGLKSTAQLAPEGVLGCVIVGLEKACKMDQERVTDSFDRHQPSEKYSTHV
jgi:hypothetical protein